jgi:hypothetical protein
MPHCFYSVPCLRVVGMLLASDVNTSRGLPWTSLLFLDQNSRNSAIKGKHAPPVPIQHRILRNAHMNEILCSGSHDFSLQSARLNRPLRINCSPARVIRQAGLRGPAHDTAQTSTPLSLRHRQVYVSFILPIQSRGLSKKKSRRCLVSMVKNFRVSHRIFHGMSEDVFRY